MDIKDQDPQLSFLLQINIFSQYMRPEYLFLGLKLLVYLCLRIP